MLAEALTGTGLLGTVHEYFWRLVEPMHAQQFGLPTPTDDGYARYLDAALQHGTTANGVFGAKLFWAHAVDLVRRTALIDEFAALPPLARLWAPFGADVRLVFLRRQCLRAALSLWRAEVTQQWGRRPGDVAAAPPEFLDVWRVSQLHAEMHGAEIAWRNILAASGLSVTEMSYADVVADLTAAVRSIARFVEVDLPSRLDIAPSYIRQADDVTAWFEAGWVDATGGCPECRGGDR